jgi:hypothetical protein
MDSRGNPARSHKSGIKTGLVLEVASGKIQNRQLINHAAIRRDNLSHTLFERSTISFSLTGRPCMAVFEHLALIGDLLKSPALDEGRPQRNRNQPGADQYDGSQDCDPCGDDDGLAPSPAILP